MPPTHPPNPPHRCLQAKKKAKKAALLKEVAKGGLLREADKMAHLIKVLDASEAGSGNGIPSGNGNATMQRSSSAGKLRGANGSPAAVNILVSAR